MKNQTQQTAPWSIKRLLEWTTENFSKSEMDQPRLCAELLLAQVLGWERIDLYVKFDHCPDEGQLARFRELLLKARHRAAQRARENGHWSAHAPQPRTRQASAKLERHYRQIAELLDALIALTDP